VRAEHTDNSGPTDSPAGTKRVPILLYHCVHRSPADAIAAYTVSPAEFGRQLDSVVGAGLTALTVTRFCQILMTEGSVGLPPRPIVITFDDGFADFHDHAAPALVERGLVATLYVTTGVLRKGGPAAEPWGQRMLDWGQLPELEAAGTEIGAHSHTHPELDAVRRRRAREEIFLSRDLLESYLQHPVRSFAYPHGYSDARVRAMVREAGFKSACAVKNAVSWTGDDRFALARLTIMSSTSPSTFRTWLSGLGARTAPRGDSSRTRAWRVARRTRAAVPSLAA